EELLELALLLLEASQSLVAIFVKSPVAARIAIAAPAPALGGALHPLHPLLHPFHAPPPAVSAAVCPACHSPTPYQLAANHDAKRPEHDETHYHQPNPGRFADVVH